MKGGTGKAGKGGRCGTMGVMVFGLVGRFSACLGLIGCFGLGFEGLETPALLALLFWKSERARSGSITDWGVVGRGQVVAGCPLLGCSCAGAAMLFDRRESARLGSMVEVRCNRYLSLMLGWTASTMRLFL